MKRSLFAALTALMIALSFVSAYPWPQFSDASWDTALFLTPIGFLKNATADSGALRSFYFDVSTGQTTFSLGQWLLVGAIQLGVATCALLFMCRLASGQRLERGSEK